MIAPILNSCLQTNSTTSNYFSIFDKRIVEVFSQSDVGRHFRKNSVEMKQAEHSKIINRIAKEKFKPFGITQKELEKISFLIFFLYPCIEIVRMSFMKMEGFKSAKFVGFDNYARLFNYHFRNALLTNTIFTIITVIYPLDNDASRNLQFLKRRVKSKHIFGGMLCYPF
mgnify:CR=1 FL=1